MRFARFPLALAVGVFLVLAAGRAEAKQVRFAGMHPIPADMGGGWCYIELPHVHVYVPAKADVLYRQHDDSYFFVGDPVPMGYEGPKHAYYGPHPVPVDVVLGEDDVNGDEIEYCYLEGPHYHYYLPPADLKFKVKGGVYFFVGDLPQVYVEAKPRYAKINAVYRTYKYPRPVVVEAPPPEYHGPIVGVEADVVVGPEIEVEPVVVEPAPAVVVAPVPVIEAHGVVAGPAIHGHVEVGVAVPTVEVHVPSAVVVEERVEVKHKKMKVKHRDHGEHRGHW